jgi:hypothetical protein
VLCVDQSPVLPKDPDGLLERGQAMRYLLLLKIAGWPWRHAWHHVGTTTEVIYGNSWLERACCQCISGIPLFTVGFMGHIPLRDSLLRLGLSDH